MLDPKSVCLKHLEIHITKCGREIVFVAKKVIHLIGGIQQNRYIIPMNLLLFPVPIPKELSIFQTKFLQWYVYIYIRLCVYIYIYIPYNYNAYVHIYIYTCLTSTYLHVCMLTMYYTK